nr:phosphoenolpyruvate carboxykinase (ATP) 1-like [Malus domestica]
MYHFISGYTALVNSTSLFVLVNTLPELKMVSRSQQQHYQRASVLMLHPTKYAAMLAGPVEGKCIKLPYTRKIIDAIHSGSLLNAKYKKIEVFGLEIPWSDMNAYNETLMKLAGLFKRNFETFTNYKIGKDNKLTDEILAAGPNF